MYKKITHNIVEEHFDHPIASQIKKSITKSRTTNDEVFLESKFRSDINSYLTTYRSRLNSMINSVTGTEEDLVKPFEEIFDNSWVDGLGNMTKPIYASEFGERMNAVFRSIPITVLIMVQLLKIGRDTTVLSRRFPGAVTEMAATLSSFNPGWNSQTVNSLFTTITTEMTNQLKARLKKDAGAELQAAQKITEAWTLFEDAFANGIINQHPERFARPSTVTTPTSYNRDIM